MSDDAKVGRLIIGGELNKSTEDHVESLGYDPKNIKSVDE